MLIICVISCRWAYSFWLQKINVPCVPKVGREFCDVIVPEQRTPRSRSPGRQGGSFVFLTGVSSGVLWRAVLYHDVDRYGQLVSWYRDCPAWTGDGLCGGRQSWR